MDPISASIIAAATLASGVGQSMYQGQQNKAQNIQNAILQKGKADQSSSSALLQKQQNALSNLIESYRGMMVG